MNHNQSGNQSEEAFDVNKRGDLNQDESGRWSANIMAAHSGYGYAPGPQPVLVASGGSGGGGASTGLHSPCNVPISYLDRRPTYDDPYGTGPLRPVGNMMPVFDPTVINGVAPLVLPPQGLLKEAVPPPSAVNLPGPSVTHEIRWRDPDLHEVVEFLGHPNHVIRATAAAYLQHLSFMDDGMKSKARTLGAIPALLQLLQEEIPEVQRNAVGALRNLSYGRQNDENKKAIRNAGGIAALIRLLRKSHEAEIRELVTGILWNLSSCEELKRAILDDAIGTLVSHLIIPHSGMDLRYGAENPYGINHGEMYWSVLFRNASGILRNVSSAGEYARKKLRECEGLVDALLHLVRAAIGKNDIDNKSIENCVCILRNLSYRCQEVVDPEYDKHLSNSENTGTSNHGSLSPSSSRAAAIIGSVGSKVGDNLGCFGGSKKKRESSSNNVSAVTPTSGTDKSLSQATAALSLTNNNSSGTLPGVNRSRSDPVRGMELLWQPEVVQPYLALLSECSNPETLEASAGAIQNLSACYWQPSVDIRAAVRKEKGLPVLVELLRMEVDRVVCAVATALRNLAMDQRNKELIGKYAMRDLVSKLPNGNQAHDGGTSDDTVAAVLATLNEVIAKNGDFAKSLLEADGMERLLYIVKMRGKFSCRVYKFTSQLLFNMWQHMDLREVYRKAGYKESHFLVRPIITSRNSNQSQGNSSNNTLSRPMSTQGGTKYEDRTLPRNNHTQMRMARPEELQLNEMGQQRTGGDPMLLSGHQGQQVPRHQQIVQMGSGVGIYQAGVTYICPPGTEPVYAQVNRERKKAGGSRDGVGTDSSSTQALLGSENSYVYDPNNEPIYPPRMPAGDSWV